MKRLNDLKQQSEIRSILVAPKIRIKDVNWKIIVLMLKFFYKSAKIVVKRIE